MTPADIQLLFQTRGSLFSHNQSSRGGGTGNGSGSGVNTASDDQGEAILTAAEQDQRTASLRHVLVAVQQYWMAGSTDVDLAAEYLGDGSRDATWRIPIGESGLLDFFLSIVSVEGLRQSLRIHTLRLIGNSCADEDDNRARVVASNHLGPIVSLLQDDSILAFVIPVLYNICVDYDPAQLQASQAHLSRALMAIVSSQRLAQCRAFLNIICKILSLLVSQEPEAALADPATPTYLLNLAARHDSGLDIEEFYMLVSVALSYLEHEPFQEELVRRAAVQSLLTALSDSYTKYDVSQIDPDDAAEFKQIRSRFTQVIADVAALPLFLSTYPLTSHVVQTFQSWVSNSYTNVNLKAAACIAIGNLARSDHTSIHFVQTVQIHVPLIQLLSKPYAASATAAHSAPPDDDDTPPPSSQLVFAILSLLKNLAIPAGNKPLLGVLLAPPPTAVLPRLWTTTDTQPLVQFSAISLTRLLLVSCPANVRRICLPLSPDPLSPAHERSNLHVLTQLFNRIDADHTKTEAARAIATVCRVLHSSPDDNGASPVLSDEWEPPENLPLSTTSSSSSPAAATSTSTHSSPPASFINNNPAATALHVQPGLPLQQQQQQVPSVRSFEQPRRARFYKAHVDMSDALTYLMTQTRFPVLRSEMWFVCALMSRSADGARFAMRALQPFEACRALVEAVSGRDMFDGHELPGGATAASGTGTDAAAFPALPTLPPSALDHTRSLDEAGVDTLAGAPEALASCASSETPGAALSHGAGAGAGAAVADAAAATATAASNGDTVPSGLAGSGSESAMPAQQQQPPLTDPSAAANIARVDRENGLILISELLKKHADLLPPFRRGVFEEILQKGGAVAIHARAQDGEP